MTVRHLITDPNYNENGRSNTLGPSTDANCPPVVAAAFQGHLSILQQLLLHGADIESASKHVTSLHAAVSNQHEETVRFLLEKGANVHFSTTRVEDNELTILHSACRTGNEKILKLLLQYSPDINLQTNHRRSALWFSSDGGHIGVVRLLLQAEVKPTQSNTLESGFSELVAAAANGHEGIVCLLLEAGADLIQQALLAASSNGHLAVVRLLLLKDKDSNDWQQNKRRALIATSSNGHLGMIRWLLDSNDNGDITQVDYHTALYAAAKNGNLDVAQLLLEKCPIMRWQDGQSNSVFMEASPAVPDSMWSSMPYPDDWKIVTRKSSDVLRAAIEGGYFLLVQALLRQGDSNTMSQECLDEFMQAASCYGSMDILLRALYQEMQGILPTRLLRNALFLAIKTGNLEVVLLVIEYGADINSNCEKYGGVFDFALKCGHMAVVESLLDKGSKFKEKPKEHWESTLNLLTELEPGDRGFSILRSGRLWNLAARLNPRSAPPTKPAPYKDQQAKIRLLVEKGPNSASEANLREQVLQEAASRGFIEAIQLLIDKGVNINACNNEKKGDALLRASYMGHAPTVQFLLDSGADFVSSHANVACSSDGCQKTRHTPLDAVLDRFSPHLNRRYDPDLNVNRDLGVSYMDIAYYLLEKDIELNVHDGRIGIWLQYAAREGNSNFFQMLLAKGVDVNMQGHHYGNALQAASRAGNVAMTDLLLKNGANVHAEGGEYLNALNAAIFSGCKDVVELLLNNGASLDSPAKSPFDNVVRFACHQGNEVMMRILIERGANVNVPRRLSCNDQRTLLHIAVQNGNLKIVRLLIDSGANINATNDYWGTALQSACYHGKITAVRLLLERGVDVCCQSGVYGSPLQISAYQGRQIICQLLLDWGADLNAPGGYYGSVLQASCLSRKPMVVQYLLDAGADINAQNGEYGNALQAACIMNSPKIVQLLLDYGANPYAPGKHDGALEAAAYEGHDRVVKLLLRRDDRPAKRYENALQVVLNGMAAKSESIYYYSSKKGYEISFRLLVEHGADVRVLHQDHINTLQLKPNKEFEMAADGITRVIRTANEKRREIVGDSKIEDAQIPEVSGPE